MPEWTGNTRDEVYAFLGEGRLEEAVAVVSPFLKFKQNDMRPVDPEAIAAFEKKLQADAHLRDLFCNYCIAEAENIHRFASFLLKHIYIDGPDFKDRIEQFVKQKRSIDDAIERLNIEAILDSGVRSVDEKIKSDFIWLRKLNMQVFASPAREILRDVGEVIYGQRYAAAIERLKDEYGYDNFIRTGYYFWTLQYDLDGKCAKSLEIVSKANPRSTAAKSAKLKSGKKTNMGLRHDSREEFMKIFAQGDALAIKSFVEKLPKMTAAQVKELCADLPDGATAVLNKDNKALEQALDWMQDAGTLGAVATEWVSQADWEIIRRAMFDYIQQLAEQTRCWEHSNERVYLRSKTKPPHLSNYFAVFAEHLDNELVFMFALGMTKSFGVRLPRYTIQGIGFALVHQIGIDAARKKVADLSEPPAGAGCDARNKYSRLLELMREAMERELGEADPIQAIAYAGYRDPITEEEGERRFKMFIEHGGGPSGYPLFPLAFINDPKYKKQTFQCLPRWMTNGRPEHVDAAFRMLMLDPPLVNDLGFDLTELTAHSLWHMKPVEVKKAIMRLRALASRGICTPAEAAKLIEQTFSSEEPATWRAAAEGIQYLRKLDTNIQLTTTDRIEEIIARDPAKNGKFLSGLLDEKKIRSSK